MARGVSAFQPITVAHLMPCDTGATWTVDCWTSLWSYLGLWCGVGIQLLFGSCSELKTNGASSVVHNVSVSPKVTLEKFLTREIIYY